MKTEHQEAVAKADERRSAAEKKRLEDHYGRPLEDLSDTEVSEGVKLFERLDGRPETYRPRVNPQPRRTAPRKS
jgi:hypothetical protein